MVITEYKQEPKPKRIVEVNPVKSSNIKAIGYDEGKEILYIMFSTNVVYEYNPVKKHAYESLSNAKSLGQFFYAFIKSNNLYKCNKLGLDTEIKVVNKIKEENNG